MKFGDAVAGDLLSHLLLLISVMLSHDVDYVCALYNYTWLENETFGKPCL